MLHYSHTYFLCFPWSYKVFYMFQGKADGNRLALWVRKQVQGYLFSIGLFINLHCGKVCFVGLLLLSLCCVGLKSVRIETDIEKLWVEGMYILVQLISFL